MTEAAGARLGGLPQPEAARSALRANSSEASPVAAAETVGVSPTAAAVQTAGQEAVPADRPHDGGPAVRRAVLVVLAVCVVVGVLQGVVWAFTAPGIPYQVLADGRFGGLPTTSTYHFVGVAIFALSGIAIGILLAVGGWQVRSARGWQMLLALVGGSLLGALIAWVVGELLAPGTDPASVGATDAGSIVVAAPSTGTMLVVLAQPAFAAAVYTFLVAWNGHPDLGRSAAVDDAHRGTVAAEPH
jgi:hypothetical protein